MIEVTVVQKDTGERETIQVPENTTLMEATRFYSKHKYIRGVEGDCGGCCSCATCHVYVDKEWITKLLPTNDDEESMLDQAFDVKDNSRLGCQIEFNEGLDGI